MKKLILSAVMMMAFVGTSFAKSGEVEIQETSFEVDVYSTNCDQVADAMVCLHDGVDDPFVYDAIWAAIWFNCDATSK